MFKKLIKTQDNLVATLLRLTLGFVIFPHGAQKVLGWFGGYGFSGTMGFFAGMGVPAVFAVLAIVAEFAGSIGLLTGFLTRVAAFGIACVMLVAVAMIHSANGFFMNWAGNQKGEGFEYHILALGLAIAVMILGGGSHSIDRKLSD